MTKFKEGDKIKVQGVMNDYNNGIIKEVRVWPDGDAFYVIDWKLAGTQTYAAKIADPMWELDGVVDSRLALPAGTSAANHTCVMVDYFGLNESFRYCQVCDRKEV